MPLRDFEHDNIDKPVTIILNSAGGSVTDGFFLAHYLAHYSKPLNVIVTGMAASMAAVILAAGGKNDNVTRYCFPSSYALIHDGYIALESTESKTADDIMTFNRQVDTDIRKFIIENTKITAEEYDTWSRK
jgi:ATP-dependent Clp protease protease subunit